MCVCHPFSKAKGGYGHGRGGTDMGEDRHGGRRTWRGDGHWGWDGHEGMDMGRTDMGGVDIENEILVVLNFNNAGANASF